VFSILKRIIKFQRILLNSTPPFTMTPQNPLIAFLYFVVIFVMISMNIFIFTGTIVYANTTLVIILPVVSIWMINRILYGDHRLFETMPVSRKYTLLNVYLLSIVISAIGYLMFCISIIGLVWLLVGLFTIFSPQNITSPPPSTTLIIDTTKGDILILCIFLILIFGGVAITFIKRKKLRLLSFLGITPIVYGFLFLLKINLPISPTTGQVEFLESFSIMPSGNIILLCVAISAVIISIGSVFIGYNLYVTNSTRS